MHLNGNDVFARVQQAGAHGECTLVGEVSGIGGGVGVVGDVAVGHVVLCRLDAVDVHNHTIVDLVVQLEGILARGNLRKVELLAEIVGRTFGLCVGAIVERRADKGLHGVDIGKSQGSLSLAPTVVGECGAVPLSAVERPLVVVFPFLAEVDDVRQCGSGSHPSCKAVSSGCFGTEDDGCEEFAVELAGGYGNVVDEEASLAGVRREFYALFAALLHVEGGVAFERGEQLVVASGVVEGALDAVGGAIGRCAFVGHHASGACGKAVDDGGDAFGGEDAAADEAEGVDILLTEVGILQHVEEDGDELVVEIEAVSAVVPVGIAVGIFLAFEGLKGRGGAECAIEIEEHEAEASAVNLAESLDVVARPVDSSHEHFRCHIVDVFVDVDDVADFLIVGIVVGVVRQHHPIVEDVLRSAHLGVAGVGPDFELVDFVAAESVVGIGVVLVVGFAHVDETLVLSVDVEHHGLVFLSLHVESGGEYDALQGGILEAASVVVSAAAHLQGLVLEEGFAFEERVVEGILSFIAFAGLDLEGTWFVGTAPSSCHCEVGFLAQAQRTVGGEVFEVDGAVPVAVPVAGRGLSASGNAVGAADVASHVVVVEVGVVGGDGEDGEGEVLVVFDEGLRDDGAGQVAVLEGTYAQRGGLVEVEGLSGLHLVAVCACRCGPVGGVDECGSGFGGMYPYGSRGVE